jgi:hypothetical protein
VDVPEDEADAPEAQVAIDVEPEFPLVEQGEDELERGATRRAGVTDRSPSRKARLAAETRRAGVTDRSASRKARLAAKPPGIHEQDEVEQGIQEEDVIQVMVEPTAPRRSRLASRRSLRIAARSANAVAPRRSARLAAKPRVCYKGCCK